MSAKSVIVSRLREEGLTYEQIGRVLGVSKQAAHQSLVPRDGFRLSTVRKVKYVGLRNWMIENRKNISRLEKEIGKERCLSNCLTGKFEPRKKTIDAILRVTGLTYEECFKEDADGQD